MFRLSCEMYDKYNEMPAMVKSGQMLENIEYWNTEKANFWQIDDTCIIQQTSDGFVSVERKYGNELFTLKTSPNNGKARLQSSFVYVTASLGAEAHLFVKSKDRRIHYSDKVMMISGSFFNVLTSSFYFCIFLIF